MLFVVFSYYERVCLNGNRADLLCVFFQLSREFAHCLCVAEIADGTARGVYELFAHRQMPYQKKCAYCGRAVFVEHAYVVIPVVLDLGPFGQLCEAIGRGDVEKVSVFSGIHARFEVVFSHLRLTP